MADPSQADWICAAYAIWNADEDSDVYISLRDEHDIECDNPDEGAWVTGARVWIPREQLDAFIEQRTGGPGPQIPEITYSQLGQYNA